MMDVYRVKRIDGALSYGVAPSPSGGGSAGDGFREHLGNQLKDDYKKRVTDILNDLSGLSGEMLIRIDIRAFEHYIGQMKALLSEIVKNAYVLNSEDIMDVRGRHRIFTSVGVVDKKLDELATDVLSQNGDNLDYLSRVDEIRGLIMDMLL
jgi:uncharacterized protein YaaR (DUF327 family)